MAWLKLDDEWLLIVGFEGNGTLNIQNHGTVSDADAYLGGATFSLSTFHPVATVNVDGSGSTWTNSATLTVGEATGSTATLNITNGGTVTNTIGILRQIWFYWNGDSHHLHLDQ